jgi:hypothetical protein
MNDATNFQELIAELPEWNDGAGISPEGWVECMGNYELAVGYSLVFWPRFVVIEDYVLREGATVENLRNWERETGGNRRAIEAVMNHIHMADLHVNADPPNEAQLRHLGQVLRETHIAKLKLDFPDRQFEVHFPDEAGLDLLDYELTFWQRD